jgi:hypothetical protein
MKHPIICPGCKLEDTVELEETENPIFEEQCLDIFHVCKNCDKVLHIAITVNKKNKDMPF